MRAQTVTALLLLGCLAAGAAAAPFISINVDIGDRRAVLSLDSDEDPLEAVLGFVAREGLGEEVVGQLIAALNREAAALPAATAAPAVSFPVNVQGVRHQLDYYAGDVPEDTVRRFLLERGVGQDPALERYVASLAGEVRRTIAGLQGQPGAPVAPSTIATVSVELDGNLYPLDVHEGETAQAAATKFASDLRLGTDSIAVLTQAIQRKLNEAAADAAPQPLFTLPILIDNTQQMLAFYPGQDPTAVANRFCAETGVTDPVGCDSVRAALQARLNEAMKPATQVVSVLVGGVAYDLEYDPAVTNTAQLAAEFCRQQWEVMYAALVNDLGTTDVSQGDCTGIMADLLKQQVGGTINA